MFYDYQLIIKELYITSINKKFLFEHPPQKKNDKRQTTNEIFCIFASAYEKITSLLATQRMKAAIVLVDRYNFKQVDIAPIFQVSIRTIKRDIESARFYGKQIHNFQKQCDHIYKYLIYIDKYCPLIPK